MGNIRLYGSTSGYTELAPPAVAPDGVLALPSGTGTIATQAYVDTAEADAIAAGGLVHINTTTFTSAASVSVDNVFTATYDNYLMLIFFTASGQTGLSMRLRASGTDDTGANYQFQEFESQSTVNTGTRLTGQTSASLGGTGADPGSHNTTQFFAPFLSQRTGYKSESYMTISGAYIRDDYGQMTVTTSFDGFTLIPGSGTFSGTLRVYGYKNS